MKAKLIASFVIVAAVVAIFASGANAHHPEVSVTTLCRQNPVSGETVMYVEVSAEAWNDPNYDSTHRINKSVTITATDTDTGTSFIVGTHEFVPENGYYFPMRFQPNLGDHYIITATATAPWGPNGEYGSEGETRSTEIDIPSGCLIDDMLPPPPPGGLVPLPPVSTTIPSVEAATPTTTTVPAESTTQDEPKTLAFTGGESTTLILGGVAAILAGVMILSTKKREKRNGIK